MPSLLAVLFRRLLLGALGAVAACGALGRADALDEPAGSQPMNVVPLAVRTPLHGINRLLVTITLCRPGSRDCITIDDVMVDTGSTGLRIEPGVLPSGFVLPAVLGPGHMPLAECLRFVHDQAWGRLVRADLRLGGMTAPDLPVQLISPDDGAHPPECPASGVSPTARATLGIGGKPTDCPDPCDGAGPDPMYFTCPDDGCRPFRGRLEPGLRVPNPVSRFPVHNTGVVFDLPAAPPGGARAVTGTLTFGIEAADDNRSGPVRLVELDGFGQFTTVLNGRSYPRSIIDSGTPTYVIPAEGIPRCAHMPLALCASPPLEFDAVMVGGNGRPVPTSLRVGDFAALTASEHGASDAVALAEAPSARGIVWGAPWFLGKRIFFGFEQPSDGQTGGRHAFYSFTTPP